MSAWVRVRTASRIHLGLFNLGGVGPWPGRRFGGVGLMVDRPGIVLRVEPAAGWSAEGPLAERALAFARTFAHQRVEAGQGGPVAPVHLRIEESAGEHQGL